MNHTKCVFLNNQKCEFNLPLLIYMLMNTFHYHSFSVKLDRCVRSCNDLSNKVCIPNKTEDLVIFCNMKFGNIAESYSFFPCLLIDDF